MPANRIDLAPSFLDGRLEQLKAEASSAGRDPFMALVARIKVLGATGLIADAQAMLRRAQSDYPVATIPPGQFTSLLSTSVMVHEFSLARSWLLERFSASYGLEFDVEVSDAHPAGVTMQVSGDEARFSFARSLYEWPACEIIFSRWAATFPLFDAYMRSPHRIDGSVDINFADIGHRPGLAFSEHTPGYYLVPDPAYLESERYAELSDFFRFCKIPWGDRIPIAFWRGATTGVGRRLVPIGHYPDPATRWRGAPRIRLCEIARENPAIIDAGLTSIIQIPDPDVEDWLQARDLMRQPVPAQSFQRYRYQIDIDGNSNSWPGLFTKLLTGCPVLKVASRRGFQQWYYDRLVPWANYIPVESDMEDLVEKVLWLRANDDAARRIGEAGRALAETLRDDQEITRAAPVFAAAMRAARGDHLVEVDFAANSDDFGSGWLEPDRDGVRAADVQACIELPKPPGLGSYVLNCEVSPGLVTPQRLIVTVNGEPVLTTAISERIRISCSLSREIATARQPLRLCFWLPSAETQLLPQDYRMVLHALGIAAAPLDAGPDSTRNR